MTKWKRWVARVEWPSAWIWLRPRIVRCLDEKNELHYDKYILQCLLEYRQQDLESLRTTLQDREQQLDDAYGTLVNARVALKAGLVDTVHTALDRTCEVLQAHIAIDDEEEFLDVDP